MLIHLILVVVLAFTFQAVPKGISGQTIRTDVPIVLKSLSDSGEAEFLDEGLDPENNPTNLPQPADNPAEQLAQTLSQTPISPNPTASLPNTAPPLPGLGALPGAAIGSPQGGMPAIGGGRPAAKVGGQPQTSFFGVAAQANSFIYLIDRSGSMNGPPLAAAKAQLLSSINALEETQRFLVIAYTNEPSLLNPAGNGRQPFATDLSKRRARGWIKALQAEGGSNHRQALMLALRQNAGEVIYFLTDTKLISEKTYAINAATLAQVRRANVSQKTIHVIHLGEGAPVAGVYNPFRDLAAENNGRYKYVNTQRLIGR